MNILTGRFFKVAVLAISVSLLITPGVQAQGFFDMLFGGGVKRERRFPPPPRNPSAYQVKKANKAYKRGGAVTRISAPSYNEYRADPLVRVDFSSLASSPQQVAFQPGADPSFSELAGSLANFELFAEKRIADALVEHYAATPQFLWIADGAPNAKAQDAMRVLADAASYGLEPRDYAVEEPSASTAGSVAKGQALMRFEMALSARVLRYIRDAKGGRIDPNRISGYYDFPAPTLDPVASLASIATTSNVADFLQSQHPGNAQYQALRYELAALRASEDTSISVDENLLLKPGESSPELPKLLSLISRGLDDELGGEFGETLHRLGGTELYSQELVPLIQEEQKRAGLKPDGVIGPRTVQAMAGVSKDDRIGKVTVALEQMRWLPSDLGARRVFINQPAYTASYWEGGQEKLNMRAVVGKTTNQTSFFYDEIEQVDYNPYWGVPQSIIVNEMLPRLRRDPGYLDRAGYEVYNAKGKRVSSSSVAWGAYGSKIPFGVRQTPSEANALGELKILFPNKHAIYMHDTPQKQYFERENRALSHGCVRLSDPRGMAAAVLGKPVEYVAEKLKKGHSSEKVDEKIPVYVAYFTAWPNANGTVEYFGDVYGRDARLISAIERTDAARAPTS